MVDEIRCRCDDSSRDRLECQALDESGLPHSYINGYLNGVEEGRKQTEPVPVRRYTDSEANLRITIKALGLQNELRAERERCDTWRRLANGYDDLRQWLRLCDDNPDGWKEFYKQACLTIFGHYDGSPDGEIEFNDARNDDG